MLYVFVDYLLGYEQILWRVGVRSDVLHCPQSSILTNVHPEKIDIADVPIVALQLLAKGNIRLRQAQNTLINGRHKRLLVSKFHFRKHHSCVLCLVVARCRAIPGDGVGADGVFFFVAQPRRFVRASIGHPRASAAHLIRGSAFGDGFKI